MKFQRSIILLLILMVAKNVTAQTIEGIWKGISLCQIKYSPCHDEIVVYHISKDSTGKSFELIANKVVDGNEEYMGTLPFIYDDQQKVFVSVDSVRNTRWEFKLTGNRMKGTLIYKGDLYRIVDVKKEN